VASPANPNLHSHFRIMHFAGEFADLFDPPARCRTQGAEERRVSRMNNASQGGAIEGNAAENTIMSLIIYMFPVSLWGFGQKSEKS